MILNKTKVSRDFSSPVPGPAGSSKDRRLPLETGRIDFARALDLLLLESLFVLLHDLVREYNDPITLLQRELVNHTVLYVLQYSYTWKSDLRGIGAC